MRTAKITLGRAGRLGLASAIVAAGFVGFTASSSYAAALTLSPAVGPVAAATSVTATGTGFKTATGAIAVNTANAAAVQFQTNASCTSTPTAVAATFVNIAKTSYNVSSATKLVVKVHNIDMEPHGPYTAIKLTK